MKKRFPPYLFSLFTATALMWLLSLFNPALITHESTRSTLDGICQIDSIVLNDRSLCRADSTFEDYSDDFFYAKIVVYFKDKPANGSLVISNSLIIAGDTSIPVAMILADSFLFDSIELPAFEDPMVFGMSASFTSTPIAPLL